MTSFTARRRTTSRRAAFTLIELLVVVGVITVLASLAIPAVQSAREAARRARCASNLKEISLAVQSFAASTQGFPPGASSPVPQPGACTISAQGLLLPFLDNAVLFNSINLAITCVDEFDLTAANTTASGQTIAIYLCPSDPYAHSEPHGVISYRANLGLGGSHYDSRGTVAMDLDGAIVFGTGPLSLAAFQDGLSNTIAFAEKPIGTGVGTFAPFRDWVHMDQPSKKWEPWTPDSLVDRCRNLILPAPLRLDGGRSWLRGSAISTGFFANVPPNSGIVDCAGGHNGGTGVFAARSYHPGGLNAALADGSVRWFSSGTDAIAWRKLGSRNGGD